MPRKKKEPKEERKITVVIDPEWKAWLENTEEGQNRLLEVSALLYQLGAQRKAETLPDGEEKQQMLRISGDV